MNTYGITAKIIEEPTVSVENQTELYFYVSKTLALKCDKSLRIISYLQQHQLKYFISCKTIYETDLTCDLRISVLTSLAIILVVTLIYK